jgi:hypothetical protein
MYTVTRQLQWPEGTAVVEISSGGIDYTNPDALVAKYPGEFDEFENPVEAVETAITICKSWRNDGTRKAKVGIGATGGMTMPFDTGTFRDARKWAKATYENLEKCPTCGSVVEDLKEWYQAGTYYQDCFLPSDDGYKYCSESCAEKASEFINEEEN